MNLPNSTNAASNTMFAHTTSLAPSATAASAAAAPVTATVKTKIGTQEYALRVSKASEREVSDAVDMVSNRFQAVLNAGKITNHERIAVMVALNLAVELNKTKKAPLQGFDFPDTDIASLRQHIGHVLRG